MKIRFKKILFTLMVISIFGILIYHLSLWKQENNFKKYAFEFNSKRSKMDLKEISKNWKFEKQNWENLNELNIVNIENKTISKFQKIFSLKNITTKMVFKNESINKNENFTSKVILFNSNLLFWKNSIESEIDTYSKKTDTTTVESLSIRYYFEDDNGNKNYYEANHSVYDTNILYCGTDDFIKRDLQKTSRKPYHGNITKQQADSILIQWNKKN